MNTPNKNSHTDKTKTRRYTFAQKEGKDYSCIKIVEGKFKDVIYHYGRVAFAPESEQLPDGKLPMKFDYTVDKNPKNLILLDNKEFIDYIGDMLIKFLDENISFSHLNDVIKIPAPTSTPGGYDFSFKIFYPFFKDTYFF